MSAARCIGSKDEQLNEREFIAGAPPCGWEGDWPATTCTRCQITFCPQCHTGRVDLVRSTDGKGGDAEEVHDERVTPAAGAEVEGNREQRVAAGEPTPDPDLDEDRRVIAAATPGPWEARRTDFGAVDDSGEPVETWWVDHSGWLEDEGSEFYLFSAADAVFVARARSRWPVLVDQATQLTRDLHTAQAQLTYAGAEVDELRRHLAYAIEVTSAECEVCEDDASTVVEQEGLSKLVCPSCAGAIHALDLAAAPTQDGPHA